LISSGFVSASHTFDAGALIAIMDLDVNVLFINPKSPVNSSQVEDGGIVPA
jgi:hypothetical protein